MNSPFQLILKLANIKFIILVPFFVTALFHVKGQDIDYSDASPSVHQDSLTCNTEAKFPGGSGEMLKFIQKNMVYPDENLAISLGYNTKIFVRFTIKKDGSPTNFELLQGDWSELYDAFVEVLKKMPNWIPARKDCRDVASEFTIPFQVCLR